MQNNQHLVVGLGKTGLSCVEYLHKKNIPTIVFYTRKNPPLLKKCLQQFPTVKIHCEQLNPDILNQISTIVVSPGISPNTPILATARTKKIPIVGDIALFIAAANAPIIAITGTNGKSSVTTLVGQMIQTANKTAIVGGNLGEPALRLLQEKAPDFYVLELSSFQLDTTPNMSSQVAVLLNCSEDHMDRYASFNDYLKAKQWVYQRCQKPVVNADQPVLWQSLPLTTPLSFGLNHIPQPNLYIENNDIKHGDNNMFALKQLPIKTKHEKQNALAACAIGTAIGLSNAAMQQALQNFTGLPHRCQWVRNKNDVNWYNDSKATNVGAAIAAISSLAETTSGKLWLIAGGDSKGADFSPLVSCIKQHVDHVILIGQAAKQMHILFKAHTTSHLATDLNDAIATANQGAQPKDVVVLAPACASFDMFTNFELRGDCFMQGVLAL